MLERRWKFLSWKVVKIVERQTFPSNNYYMNNECESMKSSVFNMTDNK